ncbi:E3 SUMO-protein ligase ZBED1-like [Protopterus annectens]|uniref:E3 SUMO-protein ligase ZBED1-like n=1 Tax=Protopterus annectens TaxID=7888 RepID=UPI001CFAA7C2|nr:E3 SUMO-protein ligase ZBED1-like [Protopterus annectens]
MTGGQEQTLNLGAIRDKGSYFYIDASDESKSNWMRYVACASNEEEHNLTVFQYRSKIYYRSCQVIPAGSELLVWIGEEYARTLGLKLGEHFKYEFGEKELLMKLFQDLHVKLPDNMPSHGTAHSPYSCNDMVSSIMQTHKANYAASNMGHPSSGFQLLEGTHNLVSLGRAQSRYWTFFGFQGDAYGRIIDKTKIICKLCGVRLSYSGNTTNLRQHLIYKHRREYNELVGGQGTIPDAQKNVETLSRDFAARAVATPPVGRSTKAIADFIVRDLMPVEVVEGEGFIQMIGTLDPNYKIPAASFLAHTILQEMQIQVKLKVIEFVKSLQHCSVSLDLWKHCSSLSYLTLTVHYIDDTFEFKNKVLSSHPVSEDFTIESVKTALMDIADEWDIRTRTAFAVGLNNTDVKLAVSKVGWKFLPCVGYILKACVESVLFHPRVVDVLNKCSKFVAAVFSSAVLNDEVSSQEPLLKVHLKMFLRDGRKWYSIYNVLQSVGDHKKYLCGLSEKLSEKDVLLQQDDWAVVQDILDILKPLAIATSTFTKDHFTSLSLVKPVITSLIYKHLAPNEWDSELARNIKNSIHEDLTMRYADKEVSQVLNLACALDPRFRGLDFLNQVDRVETFHLLKLEASQLAKSQLPEGISSTPEPCNSSPSPKKLKQESGIEFLLGDLCNVRNSSTNSVSQQAEQEISSFQTSEATSLCQDPLQWWKMHHTQYPLLARAAQKLLAVPATCVSTTWLFTDAGSMVQKKRSSLTPEHVDMLVFLNRNSSLL